MRPGAALVRATLLLAALVCAWSPAEARNKRPRARAAPTEVVATETLPVSRPVTGLGTHPVWDDGKAEISIYAGTARNRAGDTVRVEARSIVVKEDFDRRLLVKSDAAPGPKVNFPVLKQNFFLDVPAGTYTEHLMTSSFLDARAWKLVKLSATSQDGCGMTWVEVKPPLPGARPANQPWTHRSGSYWDEEGDRELRLEAGAGAQALDALPLWLRGVDLGRGGDIGFDLLPSQAAARVQRTGLVPALVHVAEAESLTVPAGRFPARRVEVRYLDVVDVYHFESVFPNRLLRVETQKGVTLELKKSLRLDYWNHTRPGDEKLLAD
ncbi:MAG: hypothetical protein HZB25_07225 [Candidatus Eisenbacteria bacterium]|nr:hypothetical protein [Candidatus Eisenbacteria bacterium]